MAKLLYGKDFGRLLKACYDAEESYRSYLIQQFGFKKDIKLRDALYKAFEVNATGTNTPYFRGLKGLRDVLSQDMTMDLYNQITDRFEQIFTGERLKRTEDALEKMLKAKLSGGKAEDIEKVMQQQMVYIIGNYKEWTFLMRGQKDIEKNSGQGSLFKAELVDVDNQKMDFIIKDAGADTTFSTYGRGDTRKFNYISNGVPLEYKNNLKKFHLVEKKQNEAIVTPIVKHHVETKNSDWSKSYDNIIIDLTMMAIINKLDEGFPVFVSSKAGTKGRDFFLCSTMLESLQTRQELQSHIVDLSQYGLDNLKILSLEDIMQIIKEDNEIRAIIENDINNIADNNSLDEDEKKIEIEKLQKQKASESILKKLIGRKTVTTNLFYGR